ncbi:hypothetical protein PDE_04194 [Penicillium oxalicum 114-2]|uniref:Uncharacterized protein n=1 Tax=Penicillium oxalicum (strain 114-2 / CGMCC 5302) TaxID=933388 RepID=S7ZEZ6_PENO1|nr:hypothetical protein PDE_04194 [Penicillium oxalicum 114-2]
MHSVTRAYRLPLTLSRPSRRMSLCVPSTPLPLASTRAGVAHARPSPHLSAPAFSTHASQLVKARIEAAHEPELGREPSLNALAMTFASLGIGKNMQRLVILVASVTAALELFIWCEYVWNWWGRRDDGIMEK